MSTFSFSISTFAFPISTFSSFKSPLICIMKLILLVQKQISEKHFQILRCFVNTFLQVRIVCTDKCISEIPRIFRQYIIGSRKNKCPQTGFELHNSTSASSFPPFASSHSGLALWSRLHKRAWLFRHLRAP